MINRLIQETEQRLWDSSSLDDSLYYQQILEQLQLPLPFKEVEHLYCFDEEYVREINEEKDGLRDKLDKIRRIVW